MLRHLQDVHRRQLRMVLRPSSRTSSRDVHGDLQKAPEYSQRKERETEAAFSHGLPEPSELDRSADAQQVPTSVEKKQYAVGDAELAEVDATVREAGYEESPGHE